MRCRGTAPEGKGKEKKKKRMGGEGKEGKGREGAAPRGSDSWRSGGAAGPGGPSPRVPPCVKGSGSPAGRLGGGQ